MQDLQYWRQYAEAGFRIVRMYAMETNSMGRMACTCNRGSNCKAPGKHPRSRNWQTDRKVSLQGYLMEIGKRGLPYYGVALDNWLVVDVDPRNGGELGLELLEERLDMTLADESLFVVSTGGGGTHYYFNLPEGVRLVTALKEFPGIDFKRGSGSFVMGVGSLHASGGTYEVTTGSPASIGDPPALLVELLTAKPFAAYEGSMDEASVELVESAMAAIPNDDVDYDNWLIIGMALRHWGNDAGWDIFDRWSQQSTKYDENETDRKWRSFGDTGARNIGTIFGIASDYGWIRPQGPAWGDIDFSTGEITQEPGVQQAAAHLRTSFGRATAADHRASAIGRIAAKVERRRQRTAPAEPATPAPVSAPPATGWTFAQPIKRPARVASADDFVPPDDDFEFGDAPQQAAKKVIESEQYQAAKPAPVSAPGSLPPAPKKRTEADIAAQKDPLPGLAGIIVEHIQRTAWMYQRPAAEAAAMQALSCAMWGARGYNGVSLSLMTLVIADSASGKDHPQKVFTRLMGEIGRPIFPETRSDKDFMYALEEGDGKLCLLIDEAHAFFGAMENPRASAYMINMAALLLKAGTMGTNDALFLARNHLKDITEAKMKQIQKYEKLISNIEEGKGRWEVKSAAEKDAECNKLQSRIEAIERRILDLQTGIKGVHFNLMASSTPVKFAQFINADSIGSGMTGRSVVFDCGYGAPPLRSEAPPDDATTFYDIAASLRQISDQAITGLEVRATDEAIADMRTIFDSYMGDEEKYNHPETGALVRRIMERIYSLSSILAAGNNWIITPPIVAAALRLCKGHLAAAQSSLKQNEWEGSEKDAKIAIGEIVLKVLGKTNETKMMARSTFYQRLEKNATVKKITKQMAGTQIKTHTAGAALMRKRIGELARAGVLGMNGSDDDYTKIWLTKKGQQLTGVN